MIEFDNEWIDDGYVNSMRMAGAEILAFKEFGTYQGQWLAKVKLPEGRDGFIMGEYGSCSGCDAFISEFGYWDEKEAQLPEFKDRLIAFGKNYLEQVMDFDEIIVFAKKESYYDLEGDEMVKWLMENK